MTMKYKYHHIGIPTENKVEGMIYIEHLKIHATDHESNPFGIQWMKYESGCRIPELVRKVAHVAFEVENLQEALRGKNVIIDPNSPSPGVVVAFIEEAGAPIEFLQFTKRSQDTKTRRKAS
jgi:hypothetical protein